MSILLSNKTKVIVQGITGKAGSFHASQMKAYGTRVVGGVTPGRGGEKWEGLPVFDTVAEAVAATGADATGIFVPAPFGADAVLEAIDAGLALIVVITEGIPVQEMLKVKAYLRNRVNAGLKNPAIIGPNGPGLITPGQAKIGIMPGYIHKPGSIGLISRSGTLTYEAVWQLTQLGLGQTTCVGIGGDPLPGTGFIETLQWFQNDPDTKAIVMIGEIGGSAEEEAAQFISKNLTKPVVGFIAGATAPAEKRMGHAGAVISQGQGTHESKIKALKAAGVFIAQSPSAIGDTMVRALRDRGVKP